MRIVEECKTWLCRISRQRWISWLGILAAVGTAAATQAGQIRPGVGLALTLLATLAAAIGRALRDAPHSQWLTLAAVALAIANTLTGFTELFSPSMLAWLGVLSTALAALGKSLLAPPDAPASGGTIR